MQDPDNQEAYQQLAPIQPSLLLQGENPRLIDEWQMAPMLWDAIRHDIDMKNKEGLYILTGSTTVDESRIQHSGAGRITRLKMHTMSLFESMDSNGKVSLQERFDNKAFQGTKSDLVLNDYARLICRGGWPSSLGKSDSVARKQISGYCETICASDLATVDGIKRDEEKVRALLRSYARNVSTQAPNSTLLADLSLDQKSIHINTVDNYLSALNKLFVIDEVSAWSPKLRSQTAVRTSKTRHFVDPAIAAYFLGAGENDLIFDLNTFGLLFESLVIRDLRVYAQFLGGSVYHYRDKSGLEVDAILHLSDGRWGAIEIKLGAKQVDQAAANLIKFKNRVDIEKMLEPSFLMVITGTQFAFQKEDGVYVVPLGCLGP